MTRLPFVILFFVVPLLFISCESEEVKNLTVRRESLSENVANYEERVGRAGKRLEKLKADLVEATENAATSLKSIESRETKLAEARESIIAIEKSEAALKQKAALLDAYQKVFVEKTLPSGAPLGEITLKDGTTFIGASFLGVVDGNVRFKHTGGIFQSPLANFPESVRNRLSARPNTSASDSYLAVLDKKPSSLMSQGEYIAAQERAATLAERARLNEAARFEAERKQEAEERRKMEQEALQKEGFRRQQLTEIDSRLDLMKQQLQQIESRQGAALSEAQGRAIPMSAKDIQVIRDSFNKSKQSLLEQISQLERERRAIQ
jgi:hypothetical protein